MQKSGCVMDAVCMIFVNNSYSKVVIIMLDSTALFHIWQIRQDEVNYVWVSIRTWQVTADVNELLYSASNGNIYV